MHCRRISGLLSAYLDAELSDEEMGGVRAHLDRCAGCRQELEELQETKRLLASLVWKTPRTELERLLVARARQAPSPYSPAALAGALCRIATAPVRPKTIVATVMLSLAGMWLASTRVESPTEGGSPDLAETSPHLLLRAPVSPVLGAGFANGAILVTAPPVDSLPPSLLYASSRLGDLTGAPAPVSLANWPGMSRSRFRIGSRFNAAGMRSAGVIPASWQGALLPR